MKLAYEFAVDKYHDTKDVVIGINKKLQDKKDILNVLKIIFEEQSKYKKVYLQIETNQYREEAGHLIKTIVDDVMDCYCELTEIALDRVPIEKH